MTKKVLRENTAQPSGAVDIGDDPISAAQVEAGYLETMQKMRDGLIKVPTPPTNEDVLNRAQSEAEIENIFTEVARLDWVTGFGNLIHLISAEARDYYKENLYEKLTEAVSQLQNEILTDFARDKSHNNGEVRKPDIDRILKIERQRIASRLNARTTRGGANNRLYDLARLKEYADKVYPTWLRAREIQKQTERSKNKSEQREWKEKIVCELNLPLHLVEELGRHNSYSPRELSLKHAAELCDPKAVNASIATLRQAYDKQDQVNPGKARK